MADVFISYARDDRPIAARLATTLEHAGYSVWWDRNIAPGSHWSDEIEEQLVSSKCVVVVWSANSIRSVFVKDEATRGQDKLIQVTLDNTSIPIGFGQIQAARLTSSGAIDASELAGILAGLKAFATPTPHGRRVAIVDDQQLALDMLRHALEQEGFEIHAFRDAKSGLLGIAQTSPDVAIIDWQMPEMTGIELIRIIRETNGISDLPIIILSSMGEQADHRAEGLDAGADDFMAKPAYLPELIKRIEVQLRRKSRR